MQKYYNDFYVITAPPSLFIPGENPNFMVDIDTEGFNSITIINISNRFARVPANGGVNLTINEKIEIQGNKGEIFTGRLSVNFIKSLLFGKLLVIRKKYI